MASPRVECVVKERSEIGEGPVWEEKESILLYVDVCGRRVSRWNSATNQIQSLTTEKFVGCVVPRTSGGYIVCEGRRFAALDWEKRSLTTIAEVDSDKVNNRFNDGKVDPAGRFFAGTMLLDWEQGRRDGSLYSLHPDNKVVKHFDNVGISNGLDWSLDHRVFYYIDSLNYMVEAFDYNKQTGSISNRRSVYKLEKEEGVPDGMTIDNEGKLWVACFDGGRVLRIDPQTGARVQTVKLPAQKITSVCFGGKDYSDLYVTSASLGLDDQELAKQPEAGCIFRVTGLGVKGLPPNSFAG
ncbi:regucalcin [Chanos chanos]|uniref:Regucalcin n=1 Tax=Chanos chanos TaxID=29144 RepID=A0A6J2VYR2_CHACN|nr:regucalcin [Chanos chanos]QNV46817.1 regucalcin [Chanos chanos]